MFQLDLTIILVALNSLVFFGFGYFIASKQNKAPTFIYRSEVPTGDLGDKPANHATGPKLGDFEPSNEPSGAIYRPTAKELKKIHEDDATREAKEAVADTLRNAEEPRL